MYKVLHNQWTVTFPLINLGKKLTIGIQLAATQREIDVGVEIEGQLASHCRKLTECVLPPRVGPCLTLRRGPELRENTGQC